MSIGSIMSLLRCTQVNAEKNAEVRRIMIERMGTERYLHETGAQVVDFEAIFTPFISLIAIVSSHI